MNGTMLRQKRIVIKALESIFFKENEISQIEKERKKLIDCVEYFKQSNLESVIDLKKIDVLYKNRDDQLETLRVELKEFNEYVDQVIDQWQYVNKIKKEENLTEEEIVKCISNRMEKKVQ